MIIQILANCLANVPSPEELAATGSKIPVAPEEIVIGVLTPQEASLRLAIIAQDKACNLQYANMYESKASFWRDKNEDNMDRVGAEEKACQILLGCREELMSILVQGLRERLMFEPGFLISVRDGLKVVKFTDKDCGSNCLGFEIA